MGKDRFGTRRKMEQAETLSNAAFTRLHHKGGDGLSSRSHHRFQGQNEGWNWDGYGKEGYSRTH